jgi:YaiO family outer membrane protein
LIPSIQYAFRIRPETKVNVPLVSVSFLVAFLAAMPAAAAAACDAALETAVAAKPDDSDTRDAYARSCARAGQHAEALAQYEQLLAQDATNVDWLLGKAQALMTLGRAREALPILADARRRAPGYEDLWRANVNALDTLDEFDAADRLLGEAAVQFPQSDWPHQRREALRERRILERGSRLFADLSYEDLSGGRSAWRGASLGATHRFGGDRKASAFAALHLEERFDTRDEQALLGFAARAGHAWSYGINADFAPDAQVLPEWSVAIETTRALAQQYTVGARFRHASYQSSDVDTLSGSVDKYAGAWSVGYSLNAAKTTNIDDPSFGHLVRLAREYGNANRAALVVGFGEEAETVAPGVVQVTDTKSISLSGLHWTSTAWGIAWEAGWYEQGDLYDRFRFRVGLEHRF